MHTEAFERAVATVEEAVDQCRGQALSAEQFGWRTVDAFLEYLHAEDPRDDVELFIAYAVEWADALGDVSLFADQMLASTIERRLRWCLERQSLRVRFDTFRNDIDRGLRRGDHSAIRRLSSICSTGAFHRMFQPQPWGGELIDLAARHRLTGALYESLRPTAPGRLAHWHRDRGRTYLRALDHLGHLAADPLDRGGSAKSARGRLVDLARFGSTAADAAVRLPVHLVSEEQAERLLHHYEQRVSFHREIIDEEGAGPSEFDDRESTIIRTVLFQIKDAARLHEVVAA